jgi:hypothetical protein
VVRLSASASKEGGDSVSKVRAPKVRRLWEVARQFSYKSDERVCVHRWETLADLCSYRRTASHPNELGAHYTTRPITKIG